MVPASGGNLHSLGTSLHWPPTSVSNERFSLSPGYTCMLSMTCTKFHINDDVRRSNVAKSCRPGSTPVDVLPDKLSFRMS
jgi:hypothetical protein